MRLFVGLVLCLFLFNCRKETPVVQQSYSPDEFLIRETKVGDSVFRYRVYVPANRKNNEISRFRKYTPHSKYTPQLTRMTQKVSAHNHSSYVELFRPCFQASYSFLPFARCPFERHQQSVEPRWLSSGQRFLPSSAEDLQKIYCHLKASKQLNDMYNQTNK